MKNSVSIFDSLSQQKFVRVALSTSMFMLSYLMMVASTSAGVVTYTLTGGTITGTLDGVAFSNATYTITAQANPLDFSTELLGPFPFSSVSTSSTMTIEGFPSFEFTLPDFGIAVLDLNFAVPGLYYAGFAYLEDVSNLLGFFSVGPLSGDPVQGPGTVIGGNLLADILYTTTAGDLIISGSANQGATYTASGTSAVPEPTSMAIFGLGALGFAYRKRRWILK